MLERALARDASAGLADDDGKLALVVELHRFARPHDRLEMTDEAVRETYEDHRMRGPLTPHLGDVRQVIHTDAEKLRGGIGDRRPEPDIGEREVGREALEAAQQVQRACREHVAEPRELSAEPRSGVDHAGADDDAEA